MAKNKKGFTIIEVVLVLAVAGLIFLRVFIALPALQLSQRNTRRRQDMARILSSLDDYAANNNGKMPGGSSSNDSSGRATERADLAKFVNRYVVGENNYVTGDSIVDASKPYDCGNSDQFCDPDGTRYNISQRQAKPFANCTGGTDLPNNCKLALSGDKHAIYYFRFAQCGDEEGYVKDGTGYADVAIMYVLEGGAIYCGDTR